MINDGTGLGGVVSHRGELSIGRQPPAEGWCHADASRIQQLVWRGRKKLPALKANPNRYEALHQQRIKYRARSLHHTRRLCKLHGSTMSAPSWLQRRHDFTDFTMSATS